MAIYNLSLLDKQDQVLLQNSRAVMIAVPKEAYEELQRFRRAYDIIGHMLSIEQEKSKEKNEFIALGLQRALDVLSGEGKHDL